MISPRTSIDPPGGPKIALAGRVVTMDADFTVRPRGVVYIDRGSIVTVRDARLPAPPGFESTPVIPTGGTIFPGLIELHNHLSYNILQLWNVPRRFTNRGQWGSVPEYRRLVGRPMKVLGSSADVVPALVRYVECKCLLGGVTTSQGIELFSNRGVRRHYRGIVRNVEQTDDPSLPEAATRIADVEAQDGQAFLARLRRQSCFLLHLSEGIDEEAREHFLALQIQPGEWAITPSLAGIHCAGLTPADFALLAEHGGAMVWSPLSNLLLYGATAKVKDARAQGVRIGLGSDWSPSGSKNLLGELKVAYLASQEAGGAFGDRDIVAMATRDAAAILKWDQALGSIEAGKRADLLVIDGATGDPYGALIKARETSIRLVLINGLPRFGRRALMQRLGVTGEAIRIGGQTRLLNLKQPTADSADGTDGALSLADARQTLADALKRLPELAQDLEAGRALPPAVTSEPRAVRAEPGVWFLALDELEETGLELRPRLPLPGRRSFTGPSLKMAAAAAPLSEILQPLALDPLTMADDGDFLDRIEAQPNLPAYVRQGLAELS